MLKTLVIWMTMLFTLENKAEKFYQGMVIMHEMTPHQFTFVDIALSYKLRKLCKLEIERKLLTPEMNNHLEESWSGGRRLRALFPEDSVNKNTPCFFSIHPNTSAQ